MMSPGGKIEWLCPNCYSGDLEQDHAAPGGYQNYYICLDCGDFFHFTHRLKLTRKQQLHRLITGEMPHEHDGK